MEVLDFTFTPDIFAQALLSDWIPEESLASNDLSLVQIAGSIFFILAYLPSPPASLPPHAVLDCSALTTHKQALLSSFGGRVCM